MSKIIKCVLIPNDPAKPVTEVEYDSADYTNLTALIFDGDRSGLFDRMVGTDEHGDDVTLWFDDEGLFKVEDKGIENCVNLRAMQLFSHLNGDLDIRQYSVPLVGNYVITGGADAEGESLDCPAWVKDFDFTWHYRYMPKPAPETAVVKGEVVDG